MLLPILDPADARVALRLQSAKESAFQRLGDGRSFSRGRRRRHHVGEDRRVRRGRDPSLKAGDPGGDVAAHGGPRRAGACGLARRDARRTCPCSRRTSGRRARGRRPLQPGQHACVCRRRRGSAGAGDRLAGRTRSRGRRAARRARAGRGATQMVGRAAADRCEPCPEPHGVDGADAPRGVAAHALGNGAEGLLPPRAHRRSLGRSALVLRRRRRIAQATSAN